MHCTGDPEGSPFKVGYAVTDILTGMTMLQGILGAIIHKERTGQGKSLAQADKYRAIPQYVSSGSESLHA